MTTWLNATSITPWSLAICSVAALATLHAVWTVVRIKRGHTANPLVALAPSMFVVLLVLIGSASQWLNAGPLEASRNQLLAGLAVLPVAVLLLGAVHWGRPVDHPATLTLGATLMMILVGSASMVGLTLGGVGMAVVAGLGAGLGAVAVALNFGPQRREALAPLSAAALPLGVAALTTSAASWLLLLGLTAAIGPETELKSELLAGALSLSGQAAGWGSLAVVVSLSLASLSIFARWRHSSLGHRVASITSLIGASSLCALSVAATALLIVTGP